MIIPDVLVLEEASDEALLKRTKSEKLTSAELRIDIESKDTAVTATGDDDITVLNYRRPPFEIIDISREDAVFSTNASSTQPETIEVEEARTEDDVVETTVNDGSGTEQPEVGRQPERQTTDKPGERNQVGNVHLSENKVPVRGK